MQRCHASVNRVEMVRPGRSQAKLERLTRAFLFQAAPSMGTLRGHDSGRLHPQLNAASTLSSMKLREALRDGIRVR
jgi:hypothetical protein